MSIVPLSSFNLIGVTANQEALIEGLQELGCCHLSGEQGEGRVAEAARPITPLQQALRYLLDSPAKRHQEYRPDADSADEVVADILSVRDRSKDVMKKIEALSHRIDNLEPWGEFSLPDRSLLGGQRFWFYQVPIYKVDKVRESELNWTIVNRDRRFAYVVVVSENEPLPTQMPVARTETGSLPISQLQQKRFRLETELDELQVARYNLSRWLNWLSQRLARSLDSRDRQQASRACQGMGELFLLRGWLPKSKLDDIERFAKSQQCVLLLGSNPDAEPPTLLSNQPMLSAGEDLVNFYQSPAYQAWDPSALLFFSFSFFFAMILADAGYALLLMAGLFFFWRRLGKTEKGRRMRTLGFSISLVSAIYGVLCGSYFGVVPQDGLLHQLHFIEIGNFDQMIAISIVVGVIHLVLANAIGAWNLWGSPRSGWHLGWVLAMIGATAFWMTDADNGLLDPLAWLAISGLILIVWNSHPVSGRGWVNVFKRIGFGLLGLADVSKAFGDILSYLRLFALGLASASLAMTCNQLAAQINNTLPEYGFILSTLILLGGHLLNLVLGLVSGLVHGLRLNFIEFYHWSLSEEGYPFKYFRKRESQLWNP